MEELTPSVFILLMLLFAAFWGVHKVSRLLERRNVKNYELTKIRADWDSSIPFIKERVDLLFQHSFPNSAIKTEGIPDKQEATHHRHTLPQD